MAVTYQTTDDFTPDTIIFSSSNVGDAYVLLDGVSIGTSGASSYRAISMTGDYQNVHIDGHVYSNSSAVYISGANSTLYVGETGTLTTLNTSNGNTAVFLNSTGNSMTNMGQISAPRQIGVLTEHGYNDIYNGGSITGATAVFLGLFGSTNDRLINAGTIHSNSIYDPDNSQPGGADGGRYGHGVFSEGDDTRVINLEGGEITASAYLSSGVSIGAYGDSDGDGSMVLNQGYIGSVHFYGVDFGRMASTETATLINEGVIAGGMGAFRGNDSGETVTNRGHMQGDIALGGGADHFMGLGGTVDGRILAGGGNDEIRLSGSPDWVHGGAGSDVLYTDGDAMTLYQIEQVHLLGLTGVAVGGDVTATTYYGSLGDDAVYAGEGDDILNGRGGADELHGEGGDDTIRGGAGDDEIHGGKGLDRLIGGAGADVYVFATTDEMSAGAAGDRIELEQGVDLIDLTQVVDGVLDFIGGAAFAGAGVAELRVIASASGHGIVMLDANGDGTEDARLVVLDNTAITADDFLL